MANLSIATQAGGACFNCQSFTGSANGCAVQCPVCVNVVNDYLSACNGTPSTGTALSYYNFMAYNDNLPVVRIPSGRYMANDCSQVFNSQSLALVKTCSDAFDYVLQYSESLANPGVVVAANNLTMSTPFSCSLANATFCPAGCQSDVNLIYNKCFSTDLVQFDGNGLPVGPYSSTVGGGGYNNNAGDTAPPNSGSVFIQASSAFVAFAGGYGALPTNQRFASQFPAVPLNLLACPNVQTLGKQANQLIFRTPPSPGGGAGR